MAKITSRRSATEEDYKKLQNWSVGTFHRVSISPETEALNGEETKKEPDSSQLRPATKEEWEEFDRNEKVLTEALKKHKPPIQFG